MDHAIAPYDFAAHVDEGGHDFLDFGCSDGYGLIAGRRILGGRKGFGIDIMPDKIAAARGRELDAILFDIDNIPDRRMAETDRQVLQLVSDRLKGTPGFGPGPTMTSRQRRLLLERYADPNRQVAHTYLGRDEFFPDDGDDRDGSPREGVEAKELARMLLCLFREGVDRGGRLPARDAEMLPPRAADLRRREGL